MAAVYVPDGPFGDALVQVVGLLVQKNQAYGNSALDPVRIFSDAPADAALRVRIDDKLSRIRAGVPDDEDTLLDLVGYLVLLLMQRRGPV